MSENFKMSHDYYIILSLLFIFTCANVTFIFFIFPIPIFFFIWKGVITQLSSKHIYQFTSFDFIVVLLRNSHLALQNFYIFSPVFHRQGKMSHILTTSHESLACIGRHVISQPKYN